MVIAMTNDDLDDLVDEWHNSPDDGTSLCDYLGMTRDEYGAWVKDPAAIPAYWLRRSSHHEAASSGGVTQLHRVINLIDSGASTERIKEWCEQQIAKRDR